MSSFIASRSLPDEVQLTQRGHTRIVRQSADLSHRVPSNKMDGEYTEQLPLLDNKLANVHGNALQQFYQQRSRTACLVNFAGIMERMDEQILPAVSRFLGCAFGAKPHQLGEITFYRALVQALASPLGGVAGHYYNRVLVITVGCLIWGTFTFLFSFSTTVYQGMFFWAFNGIGLSLMIPNGQSLIADYYTAEHRGAAFGVLHLTSSLGAMFGALYATNIGGILVFAVPGWRFAFMSVGAVSIAIGLLTWMFAEDPKCPGNSVRQQSTATWPKGDPLLVEGGTQASGKGHQGYRLVPTHEDLHPDDTRSRQVPKTFTKCGSHETLPGQQTPQGGGAGQVPDHWGDMGRTSDCNDQANDGAAGPLARTCVPSSSRVPPQPASAWQELVACVQEIREVVMIPTFLIIILQGIVGSTPWNAMVFLTLYFQLLGMSDFAASILMSVLLIGTALGGCLGGWVGDKVAHRFPNHGRIFAAQISVGIGVATATVLIKGMPRDGSPSTVFLYACLLMAHGLLTQLCAPGCNNPIFAEIVPERQRNLVYAFDRSFEGALSAMGAPLVGILAESWFGFEGTAATSGCDHPHLPANNASTADLMKAEALGNALLFFMAVPWFFCAIFYSGLHCTYPRDRARAMTPVLLVSSGVEEGAPCNREECHVRTDFVQEHGKALMHQNTAKC